MYLYVCIVLVFIYIVIGMLIFGWYYQEWENECVNFRFGGCVFMMFDFVILLLFLLYKKFLVMLIVLVVVIFLELRSFGSDDDVDEVFGVYFDVDLMYIIFVGVI